LTRDVTILQYAAALVSVNKSPRAEHYRSETSSASTSLRVGIDGAVPARVTDMPATAQPKRAASDGLDPRASAAARPPLKASPAPVVSTTGPALKAGISVDCVLLWRRAPASPSVMSA